MKLAPDFGIVGYTDRWSYRAGESVALHLSARHKSDAVVRLHRFRHLVPEGSGFDLFADAAHVPAQEVVVEPQTIRIGSGFAADLPVGFGCGQGFTLAFLVLPTCIAAQGNTLCALADEQQGIALCLTPTGALAGCCRSPDGTERRFSLQLTLKTGEWNSLVVCFDRDTAKLTMAARIRDRVTVCSTAVDDRVLPSKARLLLASHHGSFVDPAAASFNGRIESPALWTVPLDPEDALARLDRLADGAADGGAGFLTAWDFSRRMDSSVAKAVGPHVIEGQFFNLPMRAVKGSRWSGWEQNWQYAPRDYGAAYFHQDDLSDACWPVAARIRLPDDLESGLYLVEIRGDAGCDTLPIFVKPLKPGKAALAWLAPTFTYLAYANDRCLLHGANPEVLAGRLIVLTEGDCHLAAHPEYGLSLYDMHADGSGVAYASRRRPCLTFRHNQRAWQGALGSGLWNFSADLLILSWLDREGISFEIVTDDDLDTAGVEALAPYRCVMTGSHPEYHSERSHKAVGDFLGEGGRFLYLGGNGFYWRVSTHPDHPETIELRRAEDGNRSWASEPGEYYHAFDGAYGGMWRRNGRPPQALVGVGYSGQGFFKCHPYHLQPDARDARVSFLFDTPPESGAPLGDFGLSGGGAAGIEIDRADRALGTPDHALVIASCQDLSDSYVLANEEVLVNRPTVIGNLSPLLRADVVFFETPSGGAVLSTGSVAWAGSLADPRTGNDVAMLTRRALRRFLDPRGFEMPEHCADRSNAGGRRRST